MEEVTEIKNNLVFLSSNTTNIKEVLIHCIQNSLISIDESERILAAITSLDRNLLLWDLLRKRGWVNNKALILRILRETRNKHCADRIENITPNSDDNQFPERKLLLDSTWFPKEEKLPQVFQERTYEQNLLVDELKKILGSSKNGSTVINQGAAVSGMGGVGKTTTAKWFARYFQHEYDHIIWINCGEGALSISFIELAKELKIDTTLCLNLLAKKCFSALEGYACLWIFDNAECYQGPQGIREVLPKNKGFHTIITSRTKEWGSESGDGKIPELHLKEFPLQDSITFLEKNLKNDEYTEEQLKVLCSDLGNLPLALQIAVTTINSKKLNVTEYIERIQQTDHIMNQNFDGYERTINKTMKISLDIIKNHESNYRDVAHRILLIFGYITPDFVPFDLFEAVENLSKREISEAIDLLEKYSLVTCSPWYCSIHRLLQQVIRHNGKQVEVNTLRKILSAKCIVQYKLLPFTYADQETRDLFPKVRAQLIDQQKLNELMDDRRFSEAVEISLIIKNTLSQPAAVYNYAVCLEKIDRLLEAQEILQKLHHDVQLRPNSKVIQDDFYTINAEVTRVSIKVSNKGIFRLDVEMKSEFVAGLLFLIYIRLKRWDEAEKLLNQEAELLIFKATDNLNFIMKFLKGRNSINDYEINNNQKFIILKLGGRHSGKKISLNDCTLGENFPRDLNELDLRVVDFLDEDGEPAEVYNISQLLSENLKKLNICCSYNSTKLLIQLDHRHQSCFSISLEKCEVHFIRGSHLSPVKLDLTTNLFFEDNKEVENVFLNEFFDFHRMNDLTLHGKNISLNFNESFSVNEVFVYDFHFLNWKQVHWKIKELTLMNTDIPLIDQSSHLKIDTLHLRYSTVNMKSLSLLSQTVRKVKLFNVTLESNDSGDENLQLIISPCVELTDVKLFCNAFEVENIILNQIVHLGKVKELTVEAEVQMTLDLEEEFFLESLSLKRVNVINWDRSASKVNELQLQNMTLKNISVSKLTIFNELTILDSTVDIVSLNSLSSYTKDIELYRTTIELINNSGTLMDFNKFTGTAVEKFRFHEVVFKNGEEEIVTFPLSPFINLSKLIGMGVYCQKGKQQLTIDMKQKLVMNTLSLSNTKLLDWEEGNGHINTLSLLGVPFLKKNQLEIDSLILTDGTMELSCLPREIQRLTLNNCTLFSKNTVSYNTLKYVNLCCDHSLLKHFSNCPNLHTIELCAFEAKIQLDLKWIPKSVKVIKLHQNPNVPSSPNRLTAVGKGNHQLEGIIFENYSFLEVQSFLEKFQPEKIVIKTLGVRLNQIEKVMLLIKKPYKLVTIGYFTWETEEEYQLSRLSKMVNGKGNYYSFKNQRGTMIESHQFEKLLKGEKL